MASFWTRRNKKIRSVRKRYELLPQKGWKYVNIYNAVTLRQFWLDFIGSPLSVLSLFPKNDISWTVEKTISQTHRCWTQFIQLILRLSYKQKQTDRRTREGHREKNKKKIGKSYKFCEIHLKVEKKWVMMRQHGPRHHCDHCICCSMSTTPTLFVA